MPTLQHRTRGRTFTLAAVSNQGTFGPNGCSWAVTQAPAVPEDGLDAMGAEHVHDSGRCQRTLFSLVQTFPRWVEVEAPPIPTRTRRVIAVERGKSIPIPTLYDTKASRIQSRYQSLLHEGDGFLSPSDKTYLLASSTEEPEDSVAPPTEQLSVFFVGVNHGEEDPEHDAKAFKTALQAPSTENVAIRFTSLTGADVTLSNIKGWLLWLDLRATLTGSKMLVFLSGQGNSTNRMCLSNNVSISEDDLCNWLSTTRTRLGLLHSKPVTIVTDICRESKDSPSASPGGVANLVWSCSLGQRSYAIEFEDPAIPRSCFWLALFRACKSAGAGFAEFEAAFQCQLDELGRYLLYSHTEWHIGSGICKYCSNEPEGKCARPGLQVPDGSRAGWEDIRQLATFIAKNYCNSAVKIDALFLEEMKLCKFAVATDPPSAQHTGHTARHMRGASHCVFQA